MAATQEEEQEHSKQHLRLTPCHVILPDAAPLNNSTQSLNYFSVGLMFLSDFLNLSYRFRKKNSAFHSLYCSAAVEILAVTLFIHHNSTGSPSSLGTTIDGAHHPDGKQRQDCTHGVMRADEERSIFLTNVHVIAWQN